MTARISRDQLENTVWAIDRFLWTVPSTSDSIGVPERRYTSAENRAQVSARTVNRSISSRYRSWLAWISSGVAPGATHPPGRAGFAGVPVFRWRVSRARLAGPTRCTIRPVLVFGNDVYKVLHESPAKPRRGLGLYKGTTPARRASEWPSAAVGGSRSALPSASPSTGETL